LAACPNCGAALHGRFCHACGQKTASAHVSLHEFAHEAWHEFAHVDGKIFQTLGLLILKPGALTAEFLSGRRARYVSPLRLYLTFSVLFFALVAWQPHVLRSVLWVSRTPTQSSGVSFRTTRPAPDEALTAQFSESVTHLLPRTMFVLMPFFAFLTWVSYRRTSRYYVAHLYYAIHFHAFVFAMFTVFALSALAGRYGRIPRTLAIVSIVPYHYLGLKRVFGGSRLRTFVAGTAVAVSYWIAIVVVMLVVAFFVLKGS
jgi:hypothetical protein